MHGMKTWGPIKGLPKDSSMIASCMFKPRSIFEKQQRMMKEILKGMKLASNHGGEPTANQGVKDSEIRVKFSRIPREGYV